MKKAFYVFVFLIFVFMIAFVVVRNSEIKEQNLSNNEVIQENQEEGGEEQAKFALLDGRQCFSYAHEVSPEEPYTVNEFLDITITGNEVKGTKSGTQSGPDMTNGYQGNISGTVQGENINAIYSYIIEGSEGKEAEIYRTSLTGLEKLRYPLIESGDELVPDTSKEFSIMSYARVPCEASN
ncbi:MAG: hypothetical protein PHC89_02330 [Candidatus Pacebacteria bacterium]|nr:hypothetical protein [Candidatus Paceibacterota bacterium]